MPSKLDDAYRSPYDRRIPSSILYKPEVYTRTMSNIENITDYTVKPQPQQTQQPASVPQPAPPPQSDECINLITQVLNNPKCVQMLRMLLLSSESDEKLKTPEKTYDYKYIGMVGLLCLLSVFVLIELMKLFK